MDPTSPDSEAIDTPSSRNAGRIQDQFLRSFLSIALVALGVGAVLILAAMDSPPGRGIADFDAAGEASFGWGIAAGIGLIVGAAGLAFLFLHQRIAAPIAETAAAAERMAEGELGVTFPAAVPNEIGRIGEHMNGLAVNFQEVLMLVWNQTESALGRLRRIMRDSPSGQPSCLSPDVLADLASARKELETMQAMVRSFALYDVVITPDDVLTAKGNPGERH